MSNDTNQRLEIPVLVASCGNCENYAGGMCFEDGDSPEFVNAVDSPCPAYKLDGDISRERLRAAKAGKAP